ncbi:MAG TPA: hypothetical protein VEJ87_02310, partial [Acidimicrobiales bacterium]|nr:hypothetical protein [Acidimicrobiales bacterium]
MTELNLTWVVAMPRTERTSSEPQPAHLDHAYPDRADLGGAHRDRAYLDHASTTPLRPEALAAMLPFLTDRFGNPSGSHHVARDALFA